jgi:ATP-dependent DNA ligase
MPTKATKPEIKQIGAADAEKLSGVAIEQKYDGMLTYYMNGLLFSDRWQEKSKNFPHIAKDLKLSALNDSVLVGEIYIPNGNNFSVNTLAEQSKAKFCVFDVIKADGKVVTGETFIRRQELLDKMVVPTEIIHFPVDFPDFKTGWDFVIQNNAEGVVLKELNKPYGVGWYKCKRLQEIKLEIKAYDPKESGSKGAFVLEGGNRCDALSQAYVQQYETIKAAGKTPMGELEYPFLTKEGRLFQPRLRRIFVKEDEC